MEEDTQSTDVVHFFYEQLDFISKRNSRERARKLDERVNRGLAGARLEIAQAQEPPQYLAAVLPHGVPLPVALGQIVPLVEHLEHGVYEFQAMLDRAEDLRAGIVNIETVAPHARGAV